MGSGLCVLSRYPILSTAFHRYTLNGKPLKFQHGDYYVGKGCGTILIDHPVIGLTEVFNTHLHASYGVNHDYIAHRATQSWQLCNLLRASSAMGRQIIVVKIEKVHSTMETSSSNPFFFFLHPSLAISTVYLHPSIIDSFINMPF